MDADARQRAREIYVEALKITPDDYYLLENFAYFLADTGDIDGASEQWQKVRALIPQDHVAYFELGRLAGQQGKLCRRQSIFARPGGDHPSKLCAWLV